MTGKIPLLLQTLGQDTTIRKDLPCLFFVKDNLPKCIFRVSPAKILQSGRRKTIPITKQLALNSIWLNMESLVQPVTSDTP